MNKYKPGYLGKVIPANDAGMMTEFVEKKYDSFSKVYDACKNQSDNISDVKPVNNESSDSLSVKIIANPETVSTIKEAVKDDPLVTVQDSVITAKV